MKFNSEALKDAHGVYSSRMFKQIVGGSSLGRNKFWVNNSMFVTLPDTTASIHVSRLHGERFDVSAADESAQKTVDALRECPIQPDPKGYTPQQIGHVVKYLEEKFPAKPSGLEAAAPPAVVR